MLKNETLDIGKMLEKAMMQVAFRLHSWHVLPPFACSPMCILAEVLYSMSAVL